MKQMKINYNIFPFLEHETAEISKGAVFFTDPCSGVYATVSHVWSK